jgi:hypothetical protein
MPLLKKHRFDALRVADVTMLETLLTEEVCGIVVSRTWWSCVPSEQQREVLRRLIRQSSFGWFKLDCKSLPCPQEDLRAILLEERFNEPSVFEFIYQDGCQLSPADLPHLERASTILTTSASVKLCPAEIQELEARVLIGGASKHIQSRNSAAIRLTKVETAVLPGGRSGARVLRIVPDDGGAPLVVKMDEDERLREEMRRFRSFVAWWDEQLSPRIYFHAGIGLILFTLMSSSSDEPGRPAPTLEECLESALLGELWQGPYRGPSEDDLDCLLCRAVCQLKRLNERKCQNSVIASAAWIGLESLEETLRKGITWGIADLEGRTRDAFAFREAARRKLLSLSQHAVVHGDVQLRNILVRDNREPHFIDYANSGPGHPCFDLVRLESAMLFQCFRMTEDERTVGRMLFAILEGKPEDVVLATFPTLVSSVGNRLAVRTCIRCRTAALSLLDQHGGDEDDYLAMRYVISCQSLLLPQTQKGVVRGCLTALVSLLSGRRSWAAAGNR